MVAALAARSRTASAYTSRFPAEQRGLKSNRGRGRLHRRRRRYRGGDHRRRASALLRYPEAVDESVRLARRLGERDYVISGSAAGPVSGHG
jgi:hypothetical protein